MFRWRTERALEAWKLRLKSEFEGVWRDSEGV